MTLETEVVLDIAGEYSVFPNGVLSNEYNRLVALNYPFRLRYLITKNNVRHMRKWYFAANGELTTKTSYNLEKFLYRRYLKWNPTIVSMGGIWNRIVGDVTQSFINVPIPPLLTNYTLNPKLQINVDNSEARASFSNGYTSGSKHIAIYIGPNTTRTVSIGFYISEDGTDLETTDNYIVVGADSLGYLFLKNNQTNETTFIGQQAETGLNLGISLNIDTGEWAITDTGYFFTDANTNFNITGKVYPFVMVSSTSHESVEVILKTELNETAPKFLNSTIIYPLVPSMFSLPDEINSSKKYIVTNANMFSIYQGMTLYANDVVGFDENNNIFRYN